MKYVPLGFTVFQHQYGAPAHYIEVGCLPENFVLSSVMVTYLVTDDHIG